MVTNPRRSLLIAALGFAKLELENPPLALTALKTWLGSWRGIGAIIVGMNRQGFNIELREYPHGWRANFYPAGTAHSIVVGSAWEPIPWRAVHHAAWQALTTRAN